MRAFYHGDEDTFRLLDGLAVCWTLLWLVVGALSAQSIWELSELGGTVAESGRALDSAGEALQGIGELPIIGDGPRELGEEVSTTAEEIVRSGKDAKANTRQLAVLLGLSIVIIPVMPVLGFYVPVRLSRRREARLIRASLARHEGGAGLDRYLAHRAVHNLPFDALLEVSPDPWQDLSEGRVRGLADAELRRLGIVPSPWPPG